MGIIKNILLILLGSIIAIVMDVAAATVINSNYVSYSSTMTVEAALNDLFSKIDIDEKIGNMTNISGIGDGTIAGAIKTINTTLNSKTDATWLATAYDNNTSGVEKTFNMTGAKWITTTLWSGGVYDYQVTAFPSSLFGVNKQISIEYGGLIGTFTRTGDSKVKLVAPSGRLAYIRAEK